MGVTGYRVYRNGVQVGTTSTLGYTDSPGGRRGSVSYYVRAYDAAGNLGSPSNTVLVSP